MFIIDKKAQCERLKSVRKYLNLTQAQFSEKLGIEQGYYSELERGIKSLSYNMIEVISSYFIETVQKKLSLNWLLLGEGEMFIDNTISTTINGGISQIGNINGQGGKNTIGSTADSDKDKEIAALRQKIELQEQLIFSLKESITLLRQMLDK